MKRTAFVLLAALLALPSVCPPAKALESGVLYAPDPYGQVPFGYGAPLDPSDPSGRTAVIQDEENGALPQFAGPEADAVLLGALPAEGTFPEKAPANTGRFM